MDAGESGRRRLERLRQKEAELERQLDCVRHDITAVSAGIEGELKIAKVLQDLPPGWWVLHDRRKAPRSPANIDHIAIGPSGVHVIDAKNWSGQLWIGEKGIICGRRPRGDEARKVLETRDLIARELVRVGRNTSVFGVVALASNEPTTETVVHEGLAFVPPQNLVRGLTGREEVLSPEEAYRIWELLDDLHPPRAAPVGKVDADRLRALKGIRRSPALPAVTPKRPAARRARRGVPVLRLSLGLVGSLIAAVTVIAVLQSLAKELPKALTTPGLTTTAPPTPSPTQQQAAAHHKRHHRKQTR